MLRISFLLTSLCLAMLLAGCGNKGDLVKPAPEAKSADTSAPSA